MSEKYLEVKNLSKKFVVEKNIFGKPQKYLQAVDKVSFSVNKYETLGVVGESGCGKSTTGRCVLRLIDPTEGEILIDGKDICKLNEKELREYRRRLQMVFQDPMSSFDPRYTIRQTLYEPMKLHETCEVQNLENRAKELMELVGLNSKYIDKYPHEFSGGQRQRIGIARALSLNPEFLVCDEPVSALDVSIQSQVLNLFTELQEKLGLTYMFISHDLSVVKYISHRVAVMYLGRVVEYAPTEELFEHRLHPYTQALISAIPASHPSKKGQRIVLKGDVPNPICPPSGCHFHLRCPYATERCRMERPELLECSPNHFVACHKVNEGVSIEGSVN